MNDMTAYQTKLTARLWDYRESSFRDEELFDRSKRDQRRPPVFKPEHAHRNILLRARAPEGETAPVLSAITQTGRHRWFQSMKSSQALAQSVFANLIVDNKLGILAGMQANDGGVAFFDQPPLSSDAILERAVQHLGEPTSSSIDLFIRGARRVAVECKLAETEVGRCSRPTLKSENPKYCDGTFTLQKSRLDRCALISRGVRYWEFVPQLFPRWSADQDQRPCPLDATYQLVRNVLAACVRDDDSVDLENSHALLIYDSRNPAFTNGGSGYAAYRAVRAGLGMPNLLRRCSWQDLVTTFRQDPDLSWLTTALSEKYGLS
jgi:restriction endonuclease-like protein